MAAAAVVPTISSTVIANLELLNHDNYQDWSWRVKTYLLAENLWDLIEGTNEPPKREDSHEDKFNTWRMNDAKALYAIQSSCGAGALSLIRAITTAKDAWDALAEKSKLPAQPSQDRDERSVVDVYPIPINADLALDDELTIKEVRVEGHDEINVHHNDIYKHFTELVEAKLWDDAMAHLRLHPEAVGARDSESKTALHCAVEDKRLDIAKELVWLMSPEDLEVVDKNGLTALVYVVVYHPENVELAKCMVERNNKILGIFSHVKPRHLALIAHCLPKGQKMAHYLYTVTPLEYLSVTDAASLINSGLNLKYYDIAWDLIKRYPNLALTKTNSGKTPLTNLAGKRSAFLSGIRLGFWEQLIYDGIRIKRVHTIPNSCTNVQKPKSDYSIQRHPICSAIWICKAFMASLFRRVALAPNLLKLVGMNRIYQMKWTHVQIDEFLGYMCEVMKKKDIENVQGLKAALFLATERGHVEYITHLCRANPELKFIQNENGRTIFQYAVECRQEKVYNLTYGLGDPQQNIAVESLDKFENNMLHIVGSISSLAQISHIRGPALQMQRELQWFKELENVASPAALEATNKDKMTPREVFTKGHKELVKEAEMSLKETSTSCTVVGALIVTMTFAAAFTVPGGNNGDSGLPTFLNNKVFTTFIVSDAILLFSSTTSIMIFLGILTSRFAEDDFLISLPRKMILGLLTLFLSIAAMMISFSCALYLMLEGKPTLFIPIILLSTVPIASFIWMQFPFLVEIVLSTYGAGIFDRKVKKWP